MCRWNVGHIICSCLWIFWNERFSQPLSRLFCCFWWFTADTRQSGINSRSISPCREHNHAQDRPFVHPPTHAKHLLLSFCLLHGSTDPSNPFLCFNCNSLNLHFKSFPLLLFKRLSCFHCWQLTCFHVSLSANFQCLHTNYNIDLTVYRS